MSYQNVTSWHTASSAGLACRAAPTRRQGVRATARLEMRGVLRSRGWRRNLPTWQALLPTGHEGAEAATEIESRVHEMRLLDDRLGGADTMGDAERELERTGHVISAASYSQATGQLLYTALADLHQIAGWIASDAGRYEHAERLYLDGVNAAHAARNDLAAGSLLSSLAYQVANIGRPDDAVLLARAAVRGAAGAGGRPRALLLERLAWASARAGDHLWH